MKENRFRRQNFIKTPFYLSLYMYYLTLISVEHEPFSVQTQTQAG